MRLIIIFISLFLIITCASEQNDGFLTDYNVCVYEEGVDEPLALNISTYGNQIDLNDDDEYKKLPDLVQETQIIIDFVRIADSLEKKVNYHGICW